MDERRPSGDTPDRDPLPEPGSAGAARPRWPLHTLILIGLVVGAVGGVLANSLWGASGDAPAHPGLLWFATNITDPLGKIFLRLMFMVVVPLVFSALALGVLGLGDLRKLGRVGMRTLALTVVLSVTAVVIGVFLVNTIRPGGGLDPAQKESLRAHFAGKADELVSRARQAKPLRDTLLDIIPENPLQEMVGAVDGSSKGNGMLAVMFFSLVFGAALSALPRERSAALVACFEAVFDACMVIIGLAMRLAPYAVACLVFSVTSQLGGDILVTLIWFVLTGLVGMALHTFVVYPVLLKFHSGVNPVSFFWSISEAMVTAFGTSSSNATLPTTLRVATTELKLPKGIAHFVLTVGATGNQNGTALYEGVVVLFLAQVFGVDLTLGQQVTVVLMSVLAGVGTAGVPGGSLPLIVIVLQTVGVPGEGIAIILGVDRILDMCRTVVNVAGDLVIATCVSRKEQVGSSA